MNIYKTFYHAPKPEGIERRKAYIVGGGIAGLAAAAFLIDDAGMPGENVTIYEKRNDVGGCCGVIGNRRCLCLSLANVKWSPTWSACGTCAQRFPHWTRRAVPFWMKQWMQTKIIRFIPNAVCCKIRGIYGRASMITKWTGKQRPELQAFLVEPEENLENLTIENYFGKGSPYFRLRHVVVLPHHVGVQALPQCVGG